VGPWRGFSEVGCPDPPSDSREVPRIHTVWSVIPMGPFQIGSPSPLAKSDGAVPGPGCPTPVQSLDRNMWTVVSGVQVPSKSFSISL
jgi:hypothetical protein